MAEGNNYRVNYENSYRYARLGYILALNLKISSLMYIYGIKFKKDQLSSFIQLANTPIGDKKSKTLIGKVKSESEANFLASCKLREAEKLFQIYGSSYCYGAKYIFSKNRFYPIIIQKWKYFLLKESNYSDLLVKSTDSADLAWIMDQAKTLCQALNSNADQLKVYVGLIQDLNGYYIAWSSKSKNRAPNNIQQFQSIILPFDDAQAWIQAKANYLNYQNKRLSYLKKGEVVEVFSGKRHLAILLYPISDLKWKVALFTSKPNWAQYVRVANQRIIEESGIHNWATPRQVSYIAFLAAKENKMKPLSRTVSSCSLRKLISSERMLVNNRLQRPLTSQLAALD